MVKEGLIPGISSSLTVTTTPEMGIIHLGPQATQLFSSPSMIGLMERASVQLLSSYLEPTEGSVGVRVDVRHLAATPIGMKVTAKSTLAAVEGRRLSFTVEAFNEKEKIGEGTHQRVIIQKERFSKGKAVEERLQQLGIELPAPPKPAGNYVPAVLSQGLLFVSGQIPREKGEMKYSGRIGAELTPEQGYQAARLCAINSLSAAREVLKDLGKIRRVVRLAGFVRSAQGFSGQPAVVNGASDFFGEIFNEQGNHARIAVGVSELPAGAAVELEVLFEVS